MRVGCDGVVLDLRSHALDVDVERLRVADVVGAPDTIDEHFAREHAPGIGEQEMQHLELLERERHFATTHRHPVLVRIERDLTDPQRR